MNKKYKFIIVSPRQHSGGAIVLHLLCKLLQNRGYDAKIFYTMTPISYYETKKKKIWFFYFFYSIKDLIKVIICKVFPKTIRKIQSSRFLGYDYCAVKGCKRQLFPIYNRNNTIIIYPESIYGNFLKGKKIVRWFLFHNPFKGDKDAYGENELFICFREIFNDDILNPQKRKLTLNNFDFEMYKRTNYGSRKGVCYIVRKGKKRADLPKSFDGIIIDNLSEGEKVKVFNESEYCISYDLQTFYTTIASYCGCKTICVPENGKNRSDYSSVGEVRFGVAFGFSEGELEFAKSTKDKMIERISRIPEQNNREIDNFLEDIHSYF